ncbi:MAG: ParA family protein [Bryobacteraceae bacterium]|nr:ParA family protein [Bryobacteraceae bacterium]
MATVVGFISEKGGVGKTTACYHIAVGLKWFHDQRVLVVDTDYQRGGITCRFIPELLEDFRSGQVTGTTVFDKFQQLYSSSTFSPVVDVRTTEEGISLLPADPRLAQVTVEKMPASNNIRENNRQLLRHLSLLRDVLEPLSSDYDYILIDSHPEISDLLRSVVYACDYCVSPVKLDLQSTIGVPSAQQAINEVNEDMEMIIRAVGPVPGYTRTRFAGAIAMMVREWGGFLISSMRSQYRRLEASGGIFEHYVTEGDGLRQAAAQRNSVYNIDGPNADRQKSQFQAITKEFMIRCPAS